MSALPALAGIGGTFESNGTTYTWSPLTIGDMAEFEAELRGALKDNLNVIGDARDAADRAKLKEADRRSVLEVAAHEHLRLMRMGPYQLIAEFRVPNADAVWLRRHLLKHHPNITIAEVNGMLGEEAVRAVAEIIVQRSMAAMPGKVRSPQSGATAASNQTTPTTEMSGSGSGGPAIGEQSSDTSLSAAA